MIKKPLVAFSIFTLIIILVFALASCCLLGNVAGSLDDASVPAELQVEEKILDAGFRISQEGSPDGYYAENIPVIFKCSNPGSSVQDKIKYAWKIDGQIDLEGPEADYTFSSQGKHYVTLAVSHGVSYASASQNFTICGEINKFLIINTYEPDIRIQYRLENKGPGLINKIQCRVEKPFDFSPFQSIIQVTPGSDKSKEIKYENGNSAYKFNIGSLHEGEFAEAAVDCTAEVSEFILKAPGIFSQKYDLEDNELKQYTKSEKYIDSDSGKIIDAAMTITAGEENPYKKAELLYNFVTDKLDYDYEKFKKKNYEISDASEILNWDMGVCTDYSLLYAALCRASGIPCKFIVGISLRSISADYNGVSSSTHAWNEIKLPGYGWIPVDATSEMPFGGANINLNLKTFEGTDTLYRSTKIDGYPANTFGFFYYYPDANVKPETVIETTYSVTGISDSSNSSN
jgi:hypothetical protein